MPRMTRQHFQTIAETLASINPRDTGTLADTVTWERTCCYFAIRLRDTNPRFNALTFLRACGMSADDAELRLMMLSHP